jgi:hypothetical protein
MNLSGNSSNSSEGGTPGIKSSNHCYHLLLMLTYLGMFIQEGKGDKVQNTGFSGGSSKLRPNFLKGGNFKYKNSLPSKHESLSSSPSATKKKKKE